MIMDVWIYGGGFGEAILLIWDIEESNGGKPVHRQAAFIDCFGGKARSNHVSLSQWVAAGKPEIAFAAVTHPHLDHINGAGVLVRALLSYELGRIIWWGGHELRRTYGAYFYAAQRAAGEGRICALQTQDFLNALTVIQNGWQADGKATRTIVDVGFQSNVIYSADIPKGRIVFQAIGPWLIPQQSYVDWVSDKVQGTPKKGLANCTSLAFLVTFGAAQIVLGGDMEEDNWNAFYNSGGKATLTSPCLVKVSHHGSTTGCIAEMWNVGEGFFASRTQGGTHPHCVITPWRRGARQLPDPAVVTRIAKAGCHVWETGCAELSGIDRNTSALDSFIHFAIDSKANNANKGGGKYYRYTPPA